MIFPGLKKLGSELDFRNNGTYIYGFVKNTYVMFADGQNQKNVWFRFPEKLDENDRQKIESWKKKGYAKKVDFLEENAFDVKFTFVEHFVPFKVAKIKEVIEDIVEYMNEKYPQSLPKCCGDNCTETNGLEIYEVGGVPMPMCSACAQRTESALEAAYEEDKLVPNNYLIGTIAALIFSIPGILLTYLIFSMGKIAGISGLAYFYLARKGFVWAKGKLNRVGVVITSVIAFAYTAAGIFVSYIGFVMKEAYKGEPALKEIPFLDVLKITVNVVLTEAEVRKELMTNIYLSLFLCGICIIANMYQSLKSAGKVTIKKS